MPGIPGVNVFHYKSKISKAKIAKYQTASEKGIRDYTEVFDPPALTLPAVQPSSSFTHPGSSAQAIAASRQALRPVDGRGNTLAIAKPRRKKPARKINLDNDIIFEDGITSILEPEPVSSPGSELPESPLSSPPPSPQPVEMAISRAPRPTEEDDGYGANFTSYYVVDDEDDGARKPAQVSATKPPRSKKPDTANRAPMPPPANPRVPSNQAPFQKPAPRPRQSSVRHPMNALPMQSLPPLPMPTINIDHTIDRTMNRSQPPTIEVMVEKLEFLSDALVKFGGYPPAPRQRRPQGGEDNRNKGTSSGVSAGPSSKKHKDESVDDILLAMFDDEDESEDESAEAKAPVFKLDEGAADHALIYGIEFIMGALRTWAEQRIRNTHMAQWQHHNHLRAQHPMTKPAKGRGRPSKYDQEQRALPVLPPAPPSVINARLTYTPEGQAVQAFQDVLDCGMLRVNAALPTELSEPMSILYKQIDGLINNRPPEDAPWQCMPYQAQIATQKVKVERWKLEMARMNSEMNRAQQQSHQNLMHQMGVSTHLQHHGTMTDQQHKNHQDKVLELRRGQQNATSQPHLAQNLTTPMELDTQLPTRSAAPSSSRSPADVTAYNATIPTPPPTYPGTSTAQHKPTPSRSRDPMSEMKMYVGGDTVPPGLPSQHALKMRSGMKFTFSTTTNNPDAIAAFGSDAFATPQQPSSIPRRGPMDRPKTSDQLPAQVQTPVQDTNSASMPPPATRSGDRSQSNGAVSNSASPKPSTTVNGNTTATTNGHQSPTDQRPSSAKSASPVQQPSRSSHERKHSQTAEDSITVSPAPPKQAQSSESTTPVEKAANGATDDGDDEEDEVMAD